MIEDILISLSWDWTVWTFFRRIWSLRDTTFGCFGVIPHFRSCFACVASGCFWVAFFFFSYLCLLLWPFCVHMFFQENYFPGLTRTHQPVDGPGTYKVLLQSIASIFSCVLDMWSFCVHMVFSRKLLSWTDTRPVDDKYNVEKSRCALLKRKRVKGLQEWTSEVQASEPGLGEAELQASNPSKFFKEASWEGYPTRPGEPGQGKGIPESWLSEATTS